jgi:predicted methyltransferase MtxX (methanogen marker protein 4)
MYHDLGKMLIILIQIPLITSILNQSKLDGIDFNAIWFHQMDRQRTNLEELSLGKVDAMIRQTLEN